MSLNVQLKTIAFAFLFGLLTYLLKLLLKRLIYNPKPLLRIFFTTIYVTVLTIIFIKCSYIINNLNLHFYTFFFLLLGYFSGILIKTNFNNIDK